MTAACQVLLACRSAESASDTAEELSSFLDESSASCGEFIPILHPLDLSSLKCVKDTASMVLQEYLPDETPLDVLLCNAGLAGVPDRFVPPILYSFATSYVCRRTCFAQPALKPENS